MATGEYAFTVDTITTLLKKTENKKQLISDISKRLSLCLCISLNFQGSVFVFIFAHFVLPQVGLDCYTANYETDCLFSLRTQSVFLGW